MRPVPSVLSFARNPSVAPTAGEVAYPAPRCRRDIGGVRVAAHVGMARRVHGDGGRLRVLRLREAVAVVDDRAGEVGRIEERGARLVELRDESHHRAAAWRRAADGAGRGREVRRERPAGDEGLAAAAEGDGVGGGAVARRAQVRGVDEHGVDHQRLAPVVPADGEAHHVRGQHAVARRPPAGARRRFPGTRRASSARGRPGACAGRGRPHPSMAMRSAPRGRSGSRAGPHRARR